MATEKWLTIKLTLEEIADDNIKIGFQDYMQIDKENVFVFIDPYRLN